MADALSEIRRLQGEAQAAFRNAQAAGDQNAIAQLEPIFEKLLRAEDKLLLNNLAVSAAAIADLANELRQATRELEQAVGSFFTGDLREVGNRLESLGGELHDEVRHESAHDEPGPAVIADAPPPLAAAPAPEPAPPAESDPAGVVPPRSPEAYAAAFAALEIRSDWLDDVDAVIDSFFSESKNRRYRTVEQATGVPWWVVATLHSLESSQNFGKHLHNGDPLGAPTVREPKNRPAHWRPGMTWEESAADAITTGAHKLQHVSDWSVGHALEVFEQYNGLGYRRRGLMSPYLWSGSRYYEKGKFVADGEFDPSAVSAQVGGAVVLKRLAEHAEISVSPTRHTVTPRAPALLGSRAAAELDLSRLEHAREELDFPVSANSAIRVGAEGMSAKRVQEWCCLHGRPTGIDSEFAESTQRSVELFQRDNGLPVTGEVDRDTWLLLTAPMRRALAAIPDQGGLNATYLKVAGQHLRQHPAEVGGNNHGPWVRLYMEGRDGEDQLWCAGFVCTLLAQAVHGMGIDMPFRRQIGVDALVSDAKATRRFIAEADLDAPALRSSQLTPGSLFVLRKTASDWTHVGIVTQVEPTLFATIEGNTNGQDNDGGKATNSTRRFDSKDFLRLT